MDVFSGAGGDCARLCRFRSLGGERTLTRVKSPQPQMPLLFLVELEGIEPSSKQGRPVLSTRLSQTWFSCIGKTWATYRCLIP